MKPSRIEIVQTLRVGACAVALVVASAFAQPLLAQEPNLRAELDAAFEEMLDDLANPAKSFRYADLAVRTGEVRGAVAALERLLLLNPNLDNIRLELGVLYYELGSYDLARAYLEQALQAEDIPPTIAERAETYLAAAERAASPHAFSGSLHAAGRYDTNVIWRRARPRWWRTASRQSFGRTTRKTTTSAPWSPAACTTSTTCSGRTRTASKRMRSPACRTTSTATTSTPPFWKQTSAPGSRLAARHRSDHRARRRNWQRGGGTARASRPRRRS